MKHLMQKNITTLSVLFLLINLMAAIPPTRLSTRADGSLLNYAAAVLPIFDET